MLSFSSVPPPCHSSLCSLLWDSNNTALPTFLQLTHQFLGHQGSLLRTLLHPFYCWPLVFHQFPVSLHFTGVSLFTSTPCSIETCSHSAVSCYRPATSHNQHHHRCRCCFTSAPSGLLALLHLLLQYPYHSQMRDCTQHHVALPLQCRTSLYRQQYCSTSSPPAVSRQSSL